MQSTRTIYKRLPVRNLKRTLLIPKQPTRKMSFFPRAFIGDDTGVSFTPLFRLLDDFEDYSRQAGGAQNPNLRATRRLQQTFNPKFDVKEVGDHYELHGELPGIEQKDVEIEFTDAQTLTIRGKTEREWSGAIPPSHHLEGTKMSGAITEGGEEKSPSHKATVEDAPATPEPGAGKPSTSTGVTLAKEQEPPKEPQAKYWVSERNVGSFARSFTFPTRVDQDAVRASMKNGILSIIVPKAKKHEARKIAIQ